MSRTIKLLISNWPRTREFSQLLQTGKLLLTFLTMVTRLSRSTVLCKRNANEICRISEITRISAIKLRTFASDEKAAKFRCFYCSHVGEISQAGWLIETKFRGMRQNFDAKFRARWTKFRAIRTKFRFDEAKFRFGETKYRLDETKFRFHETKFRLSRICSWLQNNCNHHLMQKYRYM